MNTRKYGCLWLNVFLVFGYGKLCIWELCLEWHAQQSKTCLLWHFLHLSVCHYAVIVSWISQMLLTKANPNFDHVWVIENLIKCSSNTPLRLVRFSTTQTLTKILDLKLAGCVTDFLHNEIWKLLNLPEIKISLKNFELSMTSLRKDPLEKSRSKVFAMNAKKNIQTLTRSIFAASILLLSSVC